MTKDQLNHNILSAIKEKIPNKKSLANLLADLLCIEKEAVYRRLRGEVAFTFAEIALIANELGISLDSMISNTLAQRSKPFQLKLTDFLNPNEVDYSMMEEFISIISEAGNDPKSELSDCTNILPIGLFYGYPYIERLYLFKCLYQSAQTNKIRSFKDVVYSSRVKQYQKETLYTLKQIKNTNYIFDPFIFRYLVNDIAYYRSIDFMDEEDEHYMKGDLMRILQNMEQLAVSGMYNETGNKVSMYVANVNFDLSYWYININHLHISLIKAFALNSFATVDEDSYVILRQRIETLLRSSTLISVSGERQRMDFFEKQREIISVLH